MTEPQPEQPTHRDDIKDQVALLTATVDQLQSEVDRDSFAIVFLLGASVAVVLILALEHRRVMSILDELGAGQ